MTFGSLQTPQVYAGIYAFGGSGTRLGLDLA